MVCREFMADWNTNEIESSSDKQTTTFLLSQLCLNSLNIADIYSVMCLYCDVMTGGGAGAVSRVSRAL